MRKCKFLSKPLEINADNLQEMLDKQHDKFIEDFITNKTYFKGYPILVEHKFDNNDYGTILNDRKYKLTSFAHIVSRKTDKNKSNRELNLHRLRSCSWVKELIDIYNSQGSKCNDCQFYYSMDVVEHNCEVTYIYCTTVRYVVILQKYINFELPENHKDRIYFFIKSAFYVDEEPQHYSLLNKFRNQIL